MRLNKLITTIEIEMSGETKRYLVSAKQGDKATRFIRAKLKNMGEKYLIPDGANAIVNITKPDNKHVYNTCDYEKNEVFIELTNQILAVKGTAFCDVEIRNENNEQVITSVTFELEIEKEIRNENALESSNEFTELERMGALSKSYAVGGTGSRAGEDTDNAKYYKGEAQDARDKAAASAAGAGTSAETAVKSAKESKSYAVGGTGSRAGEDTDNAKYYKGESKSYAVGGTGSRSGEDTDNAKYYKGQAQDARDKAAASAAGAGTSAEAAVKSAKESKSYAVGGTGSRAGEDTDNAKYYNGEVKRIAEELAEGYVTGIKGNAESSYRRGNVNLTKADIGLGNVQNVATNDQTPTFTQAATRSSLVSGEKISVTFGKIMKWFADLKTGAFAIVANNDNTTAEGYVADARIVKTHGTEIDNLNSALTTHRTSGEHDNRYYKKEESDDSFQYLLKQMSSQYETLNNMLIPVAGIGTNTGASEGWAYCDKYGRVVVTRICLRVLNKTGTFTSYDLANLPYTAVNLGVGIVTSQNNGFSFPVTISENSNVLKLETKMTVPKNDDWLWGNIIYISK